MNTDYKAPMNANLFPREWQHRNKLLIAQRRFNEILTSQHILMLETILKQFPNLSSQVLNPWLLNPDFYLGDGLTGLVN